jgi:hypothetical protein
MAVRMTSIRLDTRLADEAAKVLGLFYLRLSDAKSSCQAILQPYFVCKEVCSTQARKSRQNSSMRSRSVSHEHMKRAAPPIKV